MLSLPVHLPCLPRRLTEIEAPYVFMHRLAAVRRGAQEASRIDPSNYFPATFDLLARVTVQSAMNLPSEAALARLAGSVVAAQHDAPIAFECLSTTWFA